MFLNVLNKGGKSVTILIRHEEWLTFSAFEDGLNEDGVLGQAYCHTQNEVRQLPLLTYAQVGGFLQHPKVTQSVCCLSVNYTVP